MKKILLYLILLFLPFTSQVLARDQFNKEILIGVIEGLLDQNTKNPGYPEEAIKGANIYFNDVNKAGGIFNRKIKIVFRKTKLTNASIKKEAKKLLSTNNIFAFMWPVCNYGTNAIQSVIKNNEIPILFPISGTGDNIRAKNIFYDRGTWKNEFENHIGKFFKYRPHDETTVAITQLNHFCFPARSAFLKYYQQALGRKIAGDFFYDASKYNQTIPVELPENVPAEKLKDNSNIVGLVDKLIKINPSVIFHTSILTGAFFYEIAKLKNFKTTYVVLSYFPIDFFVRYVLKTKLNNFFSTSPFPIPSSPSKAKVLQTFFVDAKKAGYDKNQLSSLMFEGYIGAKLFVETLKSTGPKLTQKKFMETLENTKNLTIDNVKFSFSPTDHIGNKRTYFYKYVDGIPILQE